MGNSTRGQRERGGTAEFLADLVHVHGHVWRGAEFGEDGGGLFAGHAAWSCCWWWLGTGFVVNVVVVVDIFLVFVFVVSTVIVVVVVVSRT